MKKREIIDNKGEVFVIIIIIIYLFFLVVVVVVVVSSSSSSTTTRKHRNSTSFTRYKIRWWQKSKTRLFITSQDITKWWQRWDLGNNFVMIYLSL